MIKKLTTISILGLMIAACDPQVSYSECRGNDRGESECIFHAISHMFVPPRL